MTTSELRRMAIPLLERPLIPPNTIEDLKERSAQASWMAASILDPSRSRHCGRRRHRGRVLRPPPHASLFHSLVTPSGTTTKPSTKLPVVDVSATPAGWVPVDYGDAQVSVPKSFFVYYPETPCESVAMSGWVFVAPELRVERGAGCLGGAHGTQAESVHPAR